MRFETNPQLILSKDEFETLDKALKLCRDMDVATSFDYVEENDSGIAGCGKCPFKDKCNHLTKDCVYVIAHTALKQIIDIAIVK